MRKSFMAYLDRMRSLCVGLVFSCSLAACGGTAFTSGGDDQGSGSSSASGGSGAGGSSSGGSGQGAGGSGTGGTHVLGQCRIDTDCVAVMDTRNPCYSPECSAPQAASKEDAAADHCLVLWEQRDAGAPADCATDIDGECPASCAVQPECITPRCESGKCSLEVSYVPGSCEPSECERLTAEADAAIAAAVACDPAVDSIQCNGSAVLTEACACPRIANEAHPELVEAAQKAINAREAACPPVPCAFPLCQEPAASYCGANGACEAM
jgi:hypothetical protein